MGGGGLGEGVGLPVGAHAVVDRIERLSTRLRPAQADEASDRPWLGFGAAISRQIEVSLQDLVPSEVEAFTVNV